MTTDPWEYISSLGVKSFHWEDPLFKEGNKICHFLEKVPCVDIDDESVLQESYGPMTCIVPQCKKTFDTVAEHAAHHRTCHNYMCSTCKNSFPTHHLLDLHLMEVHDSYFYVMAQKKPMYRCLLESCSELFGDQKERKAHCLSAHKFPSDFRYDLSWRKAGKVSINESKEKKLNDSLLRMDLDDPDTNSSNTKNKTSSCDRKTANLPNYFSFGGVAQRGFQRSSKPKSKSSRGRKKIIPSKELAKKCEEIDCEIDMKDIHEALIEDVSEEMHIQPE